MAKRFGSFWTFSCYIWFLVVVRALRSKAVPVSSRTQHASTYGTQTTQLTRQAVIFAANNVLV